MTWPIGASRPGPDASTNGLQVRLVGYPVQQLDMLHRTMALMARTTFAAEGRERAVPHGFADAVRHEPCSLEGDAKGPVKLVAADLTAFKKEGGLP